MEMPRASLWLVAGVKVVFRVHGRGAAVPQNWIWDTQAGHPVLRL